MTASLLSAGLCIAAALWGWNSGPLPISGVAVAKHELIAYHNEFDFRLALCAPLQRLDRDEAPYRDMLIGPFRFPGPQLVNVSLWPPLLASFGLGCCCIIVARSRSNRGFPVVESPRLAGEAVSNDPTEIVK
jgi:hypothetical protein